MIKNRESACLSRKKKKEYVTNLEEQISCLTKQNLELKEENSKLKTRVSQLESCLAKGAGVVGSVTSSGAAKKATVMLALFCLVSLNIGSLR